MVIESILNQIFSMKCFESIVVFIIDSGSEVDINMASINVKKREPGKLNKRCRILDEKVKILDEAKKRKLSCRVITKEFKIGKTQAANLLKNERRLEKSLQTSKARDSNI